MLDDQREEIIRTTINRYYLAGNRPTVSQWSGMCKRTACRPGSNRRIAERSKRASRTSSASDAGVIGTSAPDDTSHIATLVNIKAALPPNLPRVPPGYPPPTYFTRS